ncbi:MAG: hypothetical protein Kow0073_10570 [Immundisolibacter sp.]
MASAAPGTTRGVSMSSTRTRQRPPTARAARKLPTAVSKEPRCRGPVGEGAKRPQGGGTAVVMGGDSGAFVYLIRPGACQASFAKKQGSGA